MTTDENDLDLTFDVIKQRVHTGIALLAAFVRYQYPARQTRVALLARHTRQTLALARHRVARHGAVGRALALATAVSRVAVVAALTLVAAASVDARLALALTSRLVALVAVHRRAAVTRRAASARVEAKRAVLKHNDSQTCRTKTQPQP